MTNKRHRSPARRGSLLIVAMLLSAIVAIALTSYIQLSRTTLNVSNRAFYHNAAMNLAEQGLEEAMYSVNKSVFDPTYTFADWTTSGGDAYREWTGVTLSQGATATYRVYIYNYALANPAPKIVVSRSRVTLAGVQSAPIDKWIQVALRKTSKFANGLVAKQNITFHGQNSVDSWNSDPDMNPATAAVAYDATNPSIRHSNGSVASASVVVASVAVNNADIFGYVATGGAAPSVGAGGKITGNFSAPNGTVDTGRVDTNFTANFDPVTAPTGQSYINLGGAITTDTTLPRAADTTPNGTGLYAGYYIYEADSVNFSNKVLTISGKVVLKLTNTLTAIDIGGGSGALNINTGAMFQAYGSGDFKIAGQGVMNGGTTLATAGQPIQCQFYGTKTVGVQDFKITGNGVLSAAVYAPNATLDINGNGDVLGAFVANDIDLNGSNAAFHYDESLAKFGVNNPYRIQNWKELTTAAERSSTVAAVINW